jgi:hypothetical protein
MSDEKFDRNNFDAQVNDLRKQISDLLHRLDTAVGKEAEALRPKLKVAQERLHELTQTSAEAWKDLKPGLEKAWDEIHKSVKEAAAKFRARPK